MDRTLRPLAAAAVLAIAGFAWALAGSGGSTASACGSAGPFDFDTFEAENYTATYARANTAETGFPIPSRVT